MRARGRRIDRAKAMLDRIRVGIGRELREARESAGLSQRAVARAVWISHTQVSRIERGRIANPPLETLTRIAAAVGVDLSLRAYPMADPLRDAGHARLLERLRAQLAPGLNWRTETPLAGRGDLRAWDAIVGGRGWRIAVEAETRIADSQALQRRLALKMRDGSLDRVVLLVADTRSNREAIAAAGGGLATMFPNNARSVLAALREGRDPGGGGIVIL